MMSRAYRAESTANALAYTTLASPIGCLLLAGNERGLHLLYFQNGRRTRAPQPHWMEDKQLFREVIAQLKAYFAGELRDFALPLVLQGTEFQLAVWRLLQHIPYGGTTSYGALARALGSPEAARAVGLANGSNPIPIIVPCHRVIGSNGDLTGFGGGLPIKKRLLELESTQKSLF